MTDKLKPCPFCGGTQQEIVTGHANGGHGDSGTTTSLYCPDCLTLVTMRAYYNQFNEDIYNKRPREEELDAGVNWRNQAYASLGFYRDDMPEDEVKIIQRFIRMGVKDE